jgi:hypothetical protein
MSVASRPLNLDGQWLSHSILNLVPHFSGPIEPNPLGIAAESWVIDCYQQLDHGGTELSYNVDALGGNKSVFKLLWQRVTSLRRVQYLTI